MRPLALLLLASCGRFSFDGTADARIADARADAEIGGPVLHFKFDGDVRVESNGRYAACSANQCPTPVAGRVGSGAAQFRPPQCLSVADEAIFRAPRFTLAMWVYVDTPSWSSMVGKADNGQASTNNSYELAIAFNGTQWGVFSSSAQTLDAVQAAGWHHLIGRYDGSQLVLFVDGALASNQPATDSTYSADPFRIGCDMNNGVEDNYFFGTLDDVRLYDRALTTAEIAALVAL